MQNRAIIDVVLVGLMTFAGQASALTDAQKCEATKLKRAGQYNFCRLKAEGKAVKTGDPVDYTKCDSKFGLKWADAEAIPSCPTTGDAAAIQAQVTADADFIALKLVGPRFVDNGDGTVTDVQTGLVWEQKDDLGGIHDRETFYSWSATATAPDGTAFTTFLGTLNNGTSADGNAISGCFAGQCDWRLPTSAELQTILLAPDPCGTNPCIDPAFGPTQSDGYWSATTNAGSPSFAWAVYFDVGVVFSFNKTTGAYVRAVRGGL